jgi:23S rRNA (guanosine2251-2'-O)-methyltransferase
VNLEWVYGRQAVREVLRSGRRPVSLLRVAKGAQEQGVLAEILNLARHQNVRVEIVARDELDRLAANHQGVAVQAGEYPMVEFGDLLAECERAGRATLLLILDQIQDPQNVASLLRTAEAAAVTGVLLPFRRAAGITPAVVNASAGAVEHLKIAEANLAQAMDEIKRREIWVAGLDAGPDARELFDADLTVPLALVVGSEGEGLRPLVRKSCDMLFRLPMLGNIASLNAAVAGSIALYHALYQRSNG